MTLSRRRLLQIGLTGAAGASLAAVAGCSTTAKTSGGTSGGGAAKTTTLWYWGGGLSDKVVADAVKQFAGKTTLKTSVIGGDFKQKLVTTMASHNFVPDVTGIKGEDMASFLPQASQFIDLNTLGADKVADQFLPWKWKQGSTQDGKVIGYPIDIGPTALYYRMDMFEKAGLPTDPDKVSAQLSTWDAFYAAGDAVKKAYPKAHMINNLGSIFGVVVGQGTSRFIDESNKFIGDQDHIRAAWDTAVKAYTAGVDAKINDDSWNAAIGNGTLACEVGAAWHALDIEQAAPATKGKWRVAAGPAAGANIGGSFLAIPKDGTNHDLAFEVIQWILSPENQARGFTDAALFPSTPATYKMDALTGPDAFFGDQAPIGVFSASAEKTPHAFEAPADAAVGAPYYNELINIETKGKKPDAAWQDAVSSAKQIAQRQGVS
jgi:cellobiose transport system substrate-binding protein